ncbi:MULTISPECIES: autoinducer binding domain-containing protein [unclassified Variovorax]|uniref:autoinducer binding domain-containing protein n=1 Tax=unclassified Variovorax TaxID=663243 RepID=UPI00076BF81E|nr:MULTISPECIES: autoinducer binding domain-containing protein [unclassified Variovorax]KWT94058.1 transcriptional activator [Variovorax sp. WDL1]PNG59981.1 Regulatory protein SdiA [Variovorax sp. B4]PNG60227.1 Regulatory protein SdiA [Variovorax sp. B2]VTV13940.1 Regulatory protein SdiA [Variovorax sp. WDL1]
MGKWQFDFPQPDHGPWSDAEILTWLSSAARAFEFECCSIGIRFPLPLTNPRISVLNSYPHEWWQRYIDNSYHAIDPSVAHCTASQRPVIWSDSLFQPAKEFWDEAQSFGLRVGWAQSCRDGLGIVSMLTLSRSGETLGTVELASKERELRMLTECAHRLMLHAFRSRLIGEMRAALTEREVEILRWAADGKTGKDIALILGISLSTVRFHLKNATSKLDAGNLSGAIARAMVLDLLQGPRPSLCKGS